MSAWALVFAAVHLYWALGGTVGLPNGMSVGMNPALFVIDVLAVPLSVVGALLALSLVRPWGRLLPRRLLLASASAVCALLIVHSAPTLVEGGLVVTGLRDAKLSVLERWSLFEIEFLAGLRKVRGLASLIRMLLLCRKGSEKSRCGFWPSRLM